MTVMFNLAILIIKEGLDSFFRVLGFVVFLFLFWRFFFWWKV